MRRIESDIWWQRPVHDGRLHRVTPTSWRRWVLLGLAVLSEMGTAVPHAWRPPLAAAVALWLCPRSLLEDRARAPPDAWLRDKNAGSGRPPVLSPDACPSVADDLTSNKRHDFLQDLRHWHIHDLLHDSFRHPLLWNHLDHVNDLLPDLRHRNSENCQVHQAHLFTVTLTQGQKKKAMEWTTKKHKRWNPQQLPANSSDCSTR